MSDDEDNCISPGLPGFPGDIMIDGWMFCPHGLEECHKCCVDHRETNNIQIEDDLTPDQWEALTDCGIEDFADRDQISVEGCWKLLRTAGKVKVACKPHSKIGCMQCFDFMQQILDRVPALEAEPNAKVAAFNARRQQGGPQPPVFTPSGAAAPRPGAAASSSTAAAAAAQQPLRSI